MVGRPAWCHILTEKMFRLFHRTPFEMVSGNIAQRWENRSRKPTVWTGKSRTEPDQDPQNLENLGPSWTDQVKATWRTIWRILSWWINFSTWRTQTVGELLLADAEREIQFGENRREFREPMTLGQVLAGETRPYQKINHYTYRLGRIWTVGRREFKMNIVKIFLVTWSCKFFSFPIWTLDASIVQMDREISF